MREFIVRARIARTSANFDLLNLPDAGRMEIVCDCISAAFAVSYHLRQDTIINVVLEGPPNQPIIITVDGSKEPRLQYDEVNVARLVQKALKTKLNFGESKEVEQGVTIAKKSFEQLVKEKCSEGKQVLYLDPKGKDIREVEFKKDVVFILGDNQGLPKNTEKLIKRLGAEKVDLGPVILLACHSIVLAHNEMDRKRV